MSNEAHVEQLLVIEEMRTRALLEVDVERLSELTSESYVHVESNGRRRNKGEFLADLANAVYRFELFVIEENNVFVHGEVAWAVGRYRNVVRTAHGPNPMKLARHVRIYVRESGQWRNWFHQATEIQALYLGSSVDVP